MENQLVKTPNLIDGVAQNKLYPSFEIPSLGNKAQLKAGMTVKVGVNTNPDYDGPGAERFWGIIQSIEEDSFILIIDNNLVLTDGHGLSYGDLIMVESRNIISIYDSN